MVLDVNDFTTWIPETFALVPFDKIPFPTDPNTSICSVRSYLAVAMILWYDTEIRAAHSKVWDALQYSWHATFHTELSAVGLERWSITGPHAFNEHECTWLTETLRCMKKPALRRRVAADPGPSVHTKAVPAALKSKRAAPAKPGKRGRSADPVKKASRYFLLNISLISLITL